MIDLRYQVAYIWEDDRYLDEPPSGFPNAINEDDWWYYRHIYTYNLPGTRDNVLSEFHGHITDYEQSSGQDKLVMIGDCSLERASNAK